jgi:hypothetical protein
MVITERTGVLPMTAPIPEPPSYHLDPETGGLDPLQLAAALRRELIAGGLDPAEEADALDDLVSELRHRGRT